MEQHFLILCQRNVIIHSPNGKIIELPLPQGRGQYAAVVPRIELDESLLNLAQNAGASVLTPVRFGQINELNEHVEITTSDERKIVSRYVIAADGMWSSVRKAVGAGIDNYRGDWHAFRQYFSQTGHPLVLLRHKWNDITQQEVPHVSEFGRRQLFCHDITDIAL